MDRIICKNYDEVSLLSAYILARQIRLEPNSVLGLPTGSTPIGMYKRLVEMHKRDGLDFSGVTTFNLDEYYPIKKSNNQSYDYFMWDNFFSKININRDNVNMPNGECADPLAEADRYEKALEDIGGVDIQVLGIGVDGHIGFNEAGAELYPRTRLTDLAQSTVQANARFFANIDEVPKKAITMGIGTIMKAGSILLLISGENKAPVVKRLFNEKITTDLPASMLLLHPDVTVLLDEAAASLL